VGAVRRPLLIAATSLCKRNDGILQSQLRGPDLKISGAALIGQTTDEDSPLAPLAYSNSV